MHKTCVWIIHNHPKLAKARHPSIAEWIKKKCVVHHIMECYLTINEKKLSNHKKYMDESELYIAKLKKSTWKGYILYECNYDTWKRHNYNDNKNSVASRGLVVEGMGKSQRTHLEQLNYLLWAYNVWYMTLCFCQNP